METIFDLPGKRKRLKELEEQLASPDAWSDPDLSRKLNQEKKPLEGDIAEMEALIDLKDEVDTILELAEEEADESLFDELDQNLARLTRDVQNQELKHMLSGESDTKNAIITINSGAGGTESQDWADMLLRMYLHYAEKRDYKTDVVDFLPGEEAGIKNATITVEGRHAYGYLKAEAGVHRLVRISPFDSNKRRHTSFASVFITPEIDDSINIEVDEKDLRIDTYRSSGAGGQHVNTTDSAVRLTHLPTGIVVACQNERSQHKNKSTAMKLLKSKLYEFEMQKRRKESEKTEAEKRDISFGSQIRSYVLAPYRMVKDHRTNVETSNVDAVLDGDIHEFIREFLLRRA